VNFKFFKNTFFCIIQNTRREEDITENLGEGKIWFLPRTDALLQCKLGLRQEPNPKYKIPFPFYVNFARLF